MMLLTTKKSPKPYDPAFPFSGGIYDVTNTPPPKKKMRGRTGWDFFLVVNNIIMNISTKFQLDFLFFEVQVIFCINAADYKAKTNFVLQLLG